LFDDRFVYKTAGTSKASVDRLNAEIKKALESPALKLDAFESWYMTPEQTAARIKSVTTSTAGSSNWSASSLSRTAAFLRPGANCV